MKNQRSGFTLIELLVVISIIGVLSSIILVALSAARTKARDSRVQSDLVQLRNKLELDRNSSELYTLYNPSNGTYTERCETKPDGYFYDGWTRGCNMHWTNPDSLTQHVQIAKDVFDMSGIGLIVEANYSTPLAPANKYAIWAKLSDNKYFCVDSAGKTLANIISLPGATGVEGSAALSANPVSSMCR